jgi:hypothetical protein
MGLLQELLFKFKTPKIKKSNITRAFSYLKYVILVVFVIILPVMYMYANIPLPAFCKYICPAGTLEGGVPLVFMDERLQALLGTLFSWKILILILVIGTAVFIFRSFCGFKLHYGAC